MALKTAAASAANQRQRQQSYGSSSKREGGISEKIMWRQRRVMA